MSVNPLTLLVGAGRLYVAATGTAFPAVNAQPGAAWADLGETQGDVEATYERDTKEIDVDQESGPVEAIIIKEGITIKTNLAIHTLENLARVHSNSVTTTAAGSGTIGTREMPLIHGAGKVTHYALLFRGESQSPYGLYPAQYEVPVGYFNGSVGSKFGKGDIAQIPCEFKALVDPNAATPGAKFGRLVVQDAAALP